MVAAAAEKPHGLISGKGLTAIGPDIHKPVPARYCRGDFAPALRPAPAVTVS